MRKQGRTDRNQPEIVKALRKCGASVAITSAVGAGFPDLAVGFRNRTIFMEVKDGDAAPSDRELTPAQRVFHANWHGAPIVIVENIADALNALEVGQ